MLRALSAIYPDVDLPARIIGDPVTISWEADPGFLGAFKGALPGHYRYNRRMYCHFMQDDLPPEQRGLFLAGDEISFTPAWAEGAVQTALNAVGGIVRHLGGAAPAANPGPPNPSPPSPPSSSPNDAVPLTIPSSAADIGARRPHLKPAPVAGAAPESGAKTWIWPSPRGSWGRSSPS